jgi:prepilin-type N-terminal cleavage/methylation domain-containing protein
VIHKKTADARKHVVDSMKKEGKDSLPVISCMRSTLKKNAGFTLIELLITMVIFILVIAAGSQIFTGLLTQFKQQSKIAETNIEGVVGLEILRQDIEHAGYGLPWVIPTGLTYSEASSSPASTYNDASNPPRAILSGNNVGFNGSDYLVIKAINVATSNQCRKWTTLKAAPFGSSPAPGNPRIWVPDRENVNKKDDGTTDNNVRVIVLSPGATEVNSRTLVINGTIFFTNYSNITTSPWPPTDATETHIIYGVDPDTDLRMPFNRADYYVSTTNVPQKCAAGTGVLIKSVIEQATGNRGAGLPLLDCVADIQVIFGLDNDEDGDFVDGIGTPADGYSDDVSGLTVQQIRTRIKEVRIFILAHEGQIDANYTYPNNSIAIPPPSDPAAGLGSTFNLTALTNWQNYRWKVYTLVVKPNNLR